MHERAFDKALHGLQEAKKHKPRLDNSYFIHSFTICPLSFYSYPFFPNLTTLPLSSSFTLCYVLWLPLLPLFPLLSLLLLIRLISSFLILHPRRDFYTHFFPFLTSIFLSLFFFLLSHSFFFSFPLRVIFSFLFSDILPLSSHSYHSCRSELKQRLAYSREYYDGVTAAWKVRENIISYPSWYRIFSNFNDIALKKMFFHRQ